MRCQTRQPDGNTRTICRSSSRQAVSSLCETMIIYCMFTLKCTDSHGSMPIPLAYVISTRNLTFEIRCTHILEQIGAFVWRGQYTQLTTARMWWIIIIWPNCMSRQRNAMLCSFMFIFLRSYLTNSTVFNTANKRSKFDVRACITRIIWYRA